MSQKSSLRAFAILAMLLFAMPMCGLITTISEGAPADDLALAGNTTNKTGTWRIKKESLDPAKHRAHILEVVVTTRSAHSHETWFPHCAITGLPRTGSNCEYIGTVFDTQVFAQRIPFRAAADGSLIQIQLHRAEAQETYNRYDTSISKIPGDLDNVAPACKAPSSPNITYWLADSSVHDRYTSPYCVIDPGQMYYFNISPTPEQGPNGHNRCAPASGDVCRFAVADRSQGNYYWNPKQEDAPFLKDQTSNYDFVAGLYRNLLGREGDPGGKNYWTSVLDTGVTRANVTEAFVVTPAFFEYRELLARRHAVLSVPVDATRVIAARTNQLTPLALANELLQHWYVNSGIDVTNNANFVDAMYLLVLQRPADAGGKAYWTSVLNQGYSREGLLLEFTRSAESAQAVGVEDSASEVEAAIVFNAVKAQVPSTDDIRRYTTAPRHNAIKALFQ